MKYFTELLFLRFLANLSRASATQGLAGVSATVWAAMCHCNVAKIVTYVTVLVDGEVVCFFSPNKYDNKISQLICWLN